LPVLWTGKKREGRDRFWRVRPDRLKELGKSSNGLTQLSEGKGKRNAVDMRVVPKLRDSGKRKSSVSIASAMKRKKNRKNNPTAPPPKKKKKTQCLWRRREKSTPEIVRQRRKKAGTLEQFGEQRKGEEADRKARDQKKTVHAPRLKQRGEKKR